MPFVSPRDPERFALRLLLHKVPGPQGYADLKHVNGHDYPTFVDAAKARGLLENDEEYHLCLEEAIGHITSGPQLRQLFVTILVFGTPSNPGYLWEQHASRLCDDYKWRYQVTISKWTWIAALLKHLDISNISLSCKT